MSDTGDLGAGLACLLAIVAAAGVRDAVERALRRAPDLLALQRALYRDLTVALVAVAVVGVVVVDRPSLLIAFVIVTVYVVLIAVVVAVLHAVSLRIWQRWDRDALRPSLVDLQLEGASHAKSVWLMCREIFLMQFIRGNPDLSAFSYARYLRLALADITLSFLPMAPTGCVVVAAGVSAAWAATRVLPAIAVVVVWDAVSLLYLSLARRRLARILTRFFVDPRRLTTSQLGAFLQLGRDDYTEGADADPPPARTQLRKVSDQQQQPRPYAVVSVSLADDGPAKSASEMEGDDAGPLGVRDSALMMSTPRPQHAPSVDGGSRRPLTENEQSTRRPYWSNTEQSATRHNRMSRNGSATAKPMVEMSLATLGRGGSVSVATPRALVSTTSMGTQRPGRRTTEPEPVRASFQMAFKMMLLGKQRAPSVAQASSAASSGETDDELSESFASAGDLVRMFGGDQATQAMSADLPDSLRWWPPAALLTAAHSVLVLDAIAIAVLSLGVQTEAAALAIAVVTAALKVAVVALLLRDLTLVTSSGSMARIELMSLSSKKLAEYERGIRLNSLA